MVIDDNCLETATDPGVSSKDVSGDSTPVSRKRGPPRDDDKVSFASLK